LNPATGYHHFSHQEILGKISLKFSRILGKKWAPIFQRLPYAPYAPSLISLPIWPQWDIFQVWTLDLLHRNVILYPTYHRSPLVKWILELLVCNAILIMFIIDYLIIYKPNKNCYI
jgi:hypothetical protein